MGRPTSCVVLTDSRDSSFLFEIPVPTGNLHSSLFDDGAIPEDIVGRVDTLALNGAEFRVVDMWICPEWMKENIQFLTVNVEKMSGAGVFRGLRNLTEVTLNGPVVITDEAFYGCHRLVRFTSQNPIQRIGKCAFYRCECLEAVFVGDDVSEIGYRAFTFCKALKHFKFGTKLHIVGIGAFNGSGLCGKLSFPSLELTISEAAFRWTDITFVEFHRHCDASVEPHAFDGCQYLKGFVSSEEMVFGENALNGCLSLRVLVLSAALELGSDCFNGCVDVDQVIVMPLDTTFHPLNRLKKRRGTNWPLATSAAESRDSPFWSTTRAIYDEEQVPTICSVHPSQWWTAPGDFEVVVGSNPAFKSSTGEQFKSLGEMHSEHRAIGVDKITWAQMELWLWWSPPTGAGYIDRSRVVCRSRCALLFVTMLCAKKLVSRLLPEELWVLIFGFVRHDEIPMLRQ